MYNINKNRPFRGAVYMPIAAYISKFLIGIHQGDFIQKWLTTQILMFW